MIEQLRRRLRQEGGYTLVELIVVMAILSLVLTSLVVVFVSGLSAQKDSIDSLIAQQEARLAVDRLRREVHCANSVNIDTANYGTVTLQFPQVNSTDVCGFGATVVWRAQAVTGFPNRFELLRNDVRVADYLTQGANIFSEAPPSTTKLGSLAVSLPVNVRPAEQLVAWKLDSTIVLRNSKRIT